MSQLISRSIYTASNPAVMPQLTNPDLIKKWEQLKKQNIQLINKKAQLEKQKEQKKQQQKRKEEEQAINKELQQKKKLQQYQINKRLRQQYQLQNLIVFNKQIENQYLELKNQYDNIGTTIHQENFQVLSEYQDLFQPCQTIQEFRQKNNKLQQFKVLYCPINIQRQDKDIVCRRYYQMCKCQACCYQRVCGGNWQNCQNCILNCSWHILMCATCSVISWPICYCNGYQQWQQRQLGRCIDCDYKKLFCYKGLNYFIKVIDKLPSCICQSLQIIAQCHLFIFGNVLMNLAECGCCSVVFCNAFNCLVNIGRNIGNCCKVICCGKEKVLLKLKEVFKQKNSKLHQLKPSYFPNNICKDYSYPVCKCQKYQQCCDCNVSESCFYCFCCVFFCSWHILMCATCSVVSWPSCYSYRYQRWERDCLCRCINCDYKQLFCYQGFLFFLKAIDKLSSCICQSFQNIVQCHQAMFCNVCNCFVNIGKNIQNCCKTGFRKDKVLLKLREVYQNYEQQILNGAKK